MQDSLEKSSGSTEKVKFIAGERGGVASREQQEEGEESKMTFMHVPSRGGVKDGLLPGSG